MQVSKEKTKRQGLELFYADVGDKDNYAACVVDNAEEDTFKFVGWIRKYCFKYGTKVKLTKKELGLEYDPTPVSKPAVQTIVPCKECHEHPCTCPKDKPEDEYIAAQNMSWSD